ncbi:pectinesterase family protein [Pelobium manganitolerans]|uniref:pectinesterase family protein n=1 Tax=Pelobium manganitolerans TaxID=1842495 RepID=UPI003FA38543
MKTKLYLLFFFFLCVGKLKAQEEKLLYSTDFQDWDAVTSTTEKTVEKATDFSNEQLFFKFFQVNVTPTGADATRFVYPPNTPAVGGTQVSLGYAQSQKNQPSYIILSPLNSITKVVFKHGATGGGRGYKLWKKNSTDADWVLVSSAAANPAAGQEVTANINESNVALKFTNINESQNGYLFDLKIYGNYTFVDPQVLTTSVNIANSGTVDRLPNSDKYEKGMLTKLTANANIGYEFVKWVDAANGDADLSTDNPYTITMDAAKNIKAVFKSVVLRNFTLNVVGSNWGKVQLSPEPVGGQYQDGTEVTMTVVPNAVTTFSYWEDNSTAQQRTVTINSDVTYTATFDEIPFIVGWDFKDQATKQNKTADFYSESTNTGIISVYEPTGSTVNWLSNAGSFSPTYPNIRLWTAGADFATTRRYLKASFSTEGYKNIQVKSLVTANYQAYSVQKLQYSLDDINYTDIASVDITNAYNAGTWEELNITLPVAAEDQTRVYLKWIGDASSPVLGGNDNDGTAYTNIFVYADKEIINDTDAPLLVSTVPVENSNTATVNGSVVLTFNEKMKAGTGDITLDGKTLTGVFGSKTVTFGYEKLNYDTEYTLTVPTGALTDQSGNAFAGTTLTFRTGVRAEPTKKLFDAVVAKDGSGDYLSVIDAIAAAPAGRTTPWLIYIKNGKYTGHHDIPSTKPFIHLIGQSRDGVIISDNRLSGGENAVHVSIGATMVVNSKDCYFENITFENSWGYEQQAGPQALALYSITDRFTMNHCYLRSYQDTYLTAYSSIADRHYIKDTRIEGAVDFIYGGGDVFFDKDTITTTRSGGYIVAPSHGAGTAWGYVFSNCIINESKGNNLTTYFGRPWQNAPKTVFINTRLYTGINATGWYYKMGAIPAVFADYNTMDANGNPVDLSQRISDYEYDVKDGGGNVINTVHGTAKSSLTDTEAASYTYENVILRSGDSWDPRLMAEAPNQPLNLQLSGTNLTWDAVAYTRLYIVFRDQAVLGFTTNNQFTDATALPATSYKYTVQAVGEFGALSKLADPVETLPLKFLTFKATVAKELAPKVNLTWSTTNEVNTSKFEVERSADGKVFTKIGTVNALNTAGIHNYSFTDQSPLDGDAYYRLNQIDLDGKNAYSDLKAVNISSGISLVLYPNPVSDELNISHAKAKVNAGLEVVATNGNKVLHLSIPSASTNTKIDLTGLSVGTYILIFKNGSEKQVAKFVKK